MTAMLIWLHWIILYFFILAAHGRPAKNFNNFNKDAVTSKGNEGIFDQIMKACKANFSNSYVLVYLVKMAGGGSLDMMLKYRTLIAAP